MADAPALTESPTAPDSRERSRPLVAYVGGSGRSGSTLLELALGSGACVPVGELRYVWQRGFEENLLCSCGEPFRSCEFWGAVTQRAFGGYDGVDAARMTAIGRRVDRIRYVPSLLSAKLRSDQFGTDLGELTDVLVRLYRSIAAVSGASVLIDSSKDPSYAYLLRTTPGIDLFLLHLVRDPRAVAYSWQRRRLRPEVHGREAYMPTIAPWRTARAWSMRNTMFESLRRMGVPGTRIHYEDMVRSPGSTLSDLARRLGVPAPVGLDEEFVPAPMHTMSGNPIRFERQPLRFRADEEWRSSMDATSRLTVVSLTLPLLLGYGYTLRAAGDA